MLEINDKADKWVFFYDQDNQDFKITARTTTTNYQIQHLVIPQIEFSNVHLEMQKPTCRIESNPYKEKILQDKYITHKEAAEYEKVIPVENIIQVKNIVYMNIGNLCKKNGAYCEAPSNLTQKPVI